MKKLASEELAQEFVKFRRALVESTLKDNEGFKSKIPPLNRAQTIDLFRLWFIDRREQEAWEEARRQEREDSGESWRG